MSEVSIAPLRNRKRSSTLFDTPVSIPPLENYTPTNHQDPIDDRPLTTVLDHPDDPETRVAKKLSEWLKEGYINPNNAIMKIAEPLLKVGKAGAAAVPEFLDQAKQAPGQALNDMARYEKINPLGSALGFTGNVVAGKTARGFKQAEELGRVFGGAVDKMPRFEISDAASKVGELPKFLQGKKLNEVLDHPELFKQYPELADVEVQKMVPTLNNADKAGEFAMVEGKPVIRVRSGASPEETRSTILHEIQHVIQDKEGFPQGEHGGASGYETNPGEIEAQVVQKRMNGTQGMPDFLTQMERMRS